MYLVLFSLLTVFLLHGIVLYRGLVSALFFSVGHVRRVQCAAEKSATDKQQKGTSLRFISLVYVRQCRSDS